MEIYLFLLVIVSLSLKTPSNAIQFEDDSAANLGQTKIGEFFPNNDEPDDRYSEISAIKYVDDYESFHSNRKQLNFNGNLPVRSPPTPLGIVNENQYFSNYRPSQAINSANNANAIRKHPYQFVNPSSNYYNTYQTSSGDLSNPFYQNYANYYQYPSRPPLSYLNYYNNPTRYPSQAASANLYGHALHQPQPSQQYPNYYTNYANQFSYQRPPLGGNNGVPNLFNGSPFGQLSQVGTQFSKALEDISLNDDLQCVPKLLCQMIQNPRRPNQLPSFLNIPGLSAIISALPSSSPLMNFGRAALLGLSGGECDISYPKCPRDENQLLFYLNNHRGGFFRFFNSGNSFGDENLLEATQQQQQTQGGQGLNLLALQALAGALNNPNLNNLLASPSHQRPVTQNYQGLQADQSGSGGLLSMFQSNTLTDIVSNLLTGVVGNRFSRRLSKRSVDVNEGHRIEKRIVNLQDDEGQIFAQHQNSLYDELEKPFTFSDGSRLNNEQHLKFPQQVQDGSLVTPSDIARRLKQLFPEVDNFGEQFNQDLLRLIVNDRLGKILTGGTQQQQQRPANGYYAAVNRYQSPATQSQYTGSSSTNYNNRQPQQSSTTSHIVYVTNARGQIEYTLNELTGEKKRFS